MWGQEKGRPGFLASTCTKNCHTASTGLWRTGGEAARCPYTRSGIHNQRHVNKEARIPVTRVPYPWIDRCLKIFEEGRILFLDPGSTMAWVGRDSPHTFLLPSSRSLSPHTSRTSLSQSFWPILSVGRWLQQGLTEESSSSSECWNKHANCVYANQPPTLMRVAGGSYYKQSGPAR